MYHYGAWPALLLVASTGAGTRKRKGVHRIIIPNCRLKTKTIPEGIVFVSIGRYPVF
jgi:hypothetical protein